MIRSVSRTSHYHQWLGGLCGFLTGDMEDMSHPWHSNILHILILKWMPNFSVLAWLDVCQCQEPSCHHQWLGGHWGFLTRDIEDKGHYWLHIQVLDIGFLICVPNFSILAGLEVCRESPCPQWLWGHCGFLIRDLEDMGCPWPPNCSWRTIPDLWCAIFQNSSILEVCKEPSVLEGYLEDVDGSWQET